MKEQLKELDKLKEYMNIYIQLLNKPIHYLPTFEYFKEIYENPNYTLVYGIKRDVHNTSNNLPYNKFGDYNNTRDGKYINYWCGYKYITPKQYFKLNSNELWEE